MKKFLIFFLFAFLALASSRAVVASIAPAVPASAAPEDVVVVMDDEFLQQQQRK